MAFVYRYLTPRSRDVVYVGKTSGSDIDSLKSRISAHSHEESFLRYLPSNGYLIEYIADLSPADADILETALIGFYSPKLNKAKKAWGASGFVELDGLPWKPWPPNTNKKESKRRPEAQHPDAKYYCDRCGKAESVGAHGFPRGVVMKIMTSDSLIYSNTFLCDECCDAIDDAIIECFRNARRNLS